MVDRQRSNAELAREGLLAQGFASPHRATLDVDPNLHQLWPRLLDEEVGELKEALGRRDLVEVVDALADILYVTYQAAASYGVPIDKVFREVHRSNLTKAPEGEAVSRREDGKVLKPITFSQPKIAAILRGTED